MTLEFSESYRVGSRPECKEWRVWLKKKKKKRETERREENVHACANRIE